MMCSCCCMTVCVSEFPCKYPFRERALVAFKPRPILFIMNKICLNQLSNSLPVQLLSLTNQCQYFVTKTWVTHSHIVVYWTSPPSALLTLIQTTNHPSLKSHPVLSVPTNPWLLSNITWPRLPCNIMWLKFIIQVSSEQSLLSVVGFKRDHVIWLPAAQTTYPHIDKLVPSQCLQDEDSSDYVFGGDCCRG